MRPSSPISSRTRRLCLLFKIRICSLVGGGAKCFQHVKASVLVFLFRGDGHRRFGV